MKVISAAVFSVLFCLVLSTSSKVKQETKTAFFGENIYIDVPPQNGEVVFRPRSNASEAVLLRSGRVVSTRGQLNALGHLVLEDVKEEDEGIYVIRNTGEPADASYLVLNVRDCTLETVVKYGDTYHFPLSNIQGPITLEFRSRPNPIQLNGSHLLLGSEPPAVVLFSPSVPPPEEYAARLRVFDKRVVLHGVTMSDEGSFTVKDRDGKVRGRNCLNIIKHQDFFHLENGKTLRINLHQNHSRVSVVYTPHSDRQPRPVLDQGVLVLPPDPVLYGRLSVDGSHLVLRKVRMADGGEFRVTDLAGFPVADIDIQVKAFKLPKLYTAILALLGFIVFLLLLCLLSCLYKVHHRNQKNRKLLLIAQQAGRGDGEAFRQVVHDAYIRFSEESQMQSTWENATESTEVTIKGLEVSKPGHYQALPSYKEALEMSDSGVEFPSIALPLDSDTDGLITFTSHKLLLDAPSPMATATIAGAPPLDSPDATVVPDLDLSASRTPDSAMSPSPASNPRSASAATPTPDGSLRGDASPVASSRGTAGSDSGKSPEVGSMDGEAGGEGGAAAPPST